jgi:hypothetical protein
MFTSAQMSLPEPAPDWIEDLLAQRDNELDDAEPTDA